DLGAHEILWNFSAPVGPNQQPPHRTWRVELAPDEMPPAGIIVGKLDAPVPVFNFLDRDDHRLRGQIVEADAVQSGGIWRRGEAVSLLGRTLPPQPPNTDIGRALLVLRRVVTEMVDRDRVHAPQENILRD